MNLEDISKCRGMKLVGIEKYPKDRYCDHNFERLILTFGVRRQRKIHITCDSMDPWAKLLIEDERNIEE